MSNDTICAIATAPSGAIGVIRVSGSRSIEIVSRVFNKELTDARGYTLHFGTVGHDLDDALVSIFRAPHSYTGEDSAEISLHGSRYILTRVMELLIEEGARQALPGEFTQRAFLNGKMDLSQAEAVADLIASSSAATHRMAMSQLRGGFSRELAILRDQLLHLTTLLELELDFSEEDVEFADRAQLRALSAQIEERIAHLADSFHTGNALKEGVPVAIIGAPNVGKSTLLNTLLHEDRAIVSEIQGTTRDLIEDTIQLQGITFRFIDTAGIRDTRDTIELMGIERSQRAASRAQIIILMSEPGVPEPDIHTEEHQTVIHVCNKTLEFQALNGVGVHELEQRLVEAVPQVQEGDVVVSNVRHYEALTAALADIRRVIDALSQHIPGDLVAQDLRQCLFHLAEITGGEITNDEVLGSVFKNFCVGK